VKPSALAAIIRLRAVAILGLVLLAACPGTKPIKELLDDPSRFDGQTVRIAGEVKESIGALGVGVYQINDGTGTLTVMSKAGNGTPRVGAKVGVEGEFRSAFTLGSQSLAVLVEQKRRSP
jgi:hypothetical protein